MAVCIHEAGHALARWYVGLPFQEVSIDLGSQQPPDSSGLPRAAAVMGFDFVPPRRTWIGLAAAGDTEALVRGRAATEMEMFAAYAGPFAEARCRVRYKVRREGGAVLHRRRRVDVDSLLHAGGGEADWSLIEADAADWPDGIAMAARARRLADAFVRGRAAWGAIREVARLLTVGLRLGWDDVEAVAGRHFGRRPSPGCRDWLAHWPPLALAVRGGFLPPKGDSGESSILELMG
jgi:hypothetical protein